MRAQKIDKTYSAKQQNSNGWITEAGSGIGPNQVEVHCQGRVKKKKSILHTTYVLATAVNWRLNFQKTHATRPVVTYTKTG